MWTFCFTVHDNSVCHRDLKPEVITLPYTHTPSKPHGPFFSSRSFVLLYCVVVVEWYVCVCVYYVCVIVWRGGTRERAQNILRDENGRCRITDFGVSQFCGLDDHGSGSATEFKKLLENELLGEADLKGGGKDNVSWSGDVYFMYYYSFYAWYLLCGLYHPVCVPISLLLRSVIVFRGMMTSSPRLR